MDEDLRDRIEREAERHALFNAVKHGGEADVGAVVGPLMGENPEFREHGDRVPGVVAPVVGRINDLSPDERRARLAEIAPEMVEQLAADDEDERPLPELPSVADYEEVRMRCAPNPNGPWHLGSARMGAVIGSYRDRYDGWMLCRFDDTDPETKRPDLDAYDRILEDLAYLGFEPDDVIRASDRLETYYDHARDLIEAGGAYTCSCPPEEFSRLKNGGDPCDHRDRSRERTREQFETMVAGDYDPGEMVLRVRTDIDHPNPALRDWVAFRMIDTPHPREAAAEYRCWPMLDFQSAVDDHLTEITHIIRGIDLQDSAKRQQFLYDHLGWEYPEVVHWGRIQVDEYDVPLSTSTIAGLIDDGELDGWDDPRAPTVASLQRRGVRGAALTEALAELGTSTNDVDLAMSSVYAANRERVDPEADRLFMVRESDDAGGVVERQVLGGPDVGQPPVHPEFEDRGTRELSVVDGVLLEGGDLPPNGDRVWLKGYGCVRHVRDALQYESQDVDLIREEGVDVVHWVPAGHNRRVRLRTPDGDVHGRAEAGLAAYDPGDLVQFERVGFARIDEHPGDAAGGDDGTGPDAADAAADGSDGPDAPRTVAYFAHR